MSRPVVRSLGLVLLAVLVVFFGLRDAADAKVSGNTIDVKVKRVGRFDLFLSDDLVDLGKPVVVKVNGETVHEGVVPPDVEFMLKQAAWDEDRALVYSARLRVDVPKK